MQRRTVLSRSAGVLALSVPLAGCSGGSNDTEDGDDDGDNGDDGDDGGTPTPSGPGEVVENTVDGLEIVGMEVDESDDERYTVVLTVRNTGDQETDAFDYEYGLTVFDAEGNDVTAGVSGTSATGATIAPGEETEIRATTGFEGEKSDIVSFEVTVGCDDFGDAGVYCQ